jgi:tripeptide aminopeptidase
MDNSLIQRILAQAVAIQQIPAPTFHESQRAAFVQAGFTADGLADVQMDSQGNVHGRLPGLDSARPLVVSAHLDTVFPLSTDLTVQVTPEKISGPGIGDNSLGVAGLFGLLWALQARQSARHGNLLQRDIWFVANVGEEGLGDLNGMRSVVDRFGSQACAYLILEGMALGQIYHRALGVQRFRITVRTAGGHSWVDYGRPSAIHELAILVSRLTNLSLPRQPRTTFNVGVISGGTSVNTIAAEASIELDLRSEGDRALKSLVGHVQELVSVSNRPGVSVSAESIGNRPAGNISPDHPLVQIAIRGLRERGLSPNLSIGSTDANVPLSRGFPAVCIGLSTGHGAHTVKEFINTEPLTTGISQLVTLTEGILAEI